jgi:hypothetical protein
VGSGTRGGLSPGGPGMPVTLTTGAGGMGSPRIGIGGSWAEVASPG